MVWGNVFSLIDVMYYIVEGIVGYWNLVIMGVDYICGVIVSIIYLGIGIGVICIVGGGDVFR